MFRLSAELLDLLLGCAQVRGISGQHIIKLAGNSLDKLTANLGSETLKRRYIHFESEANTLSLLNLERCDFPERLDPPRQLFLSRDVRQAAIRLKR